MNNPIGIIGGMGPEASILMSQYILEAVEVSCDQDHVPFIHYSENRIPDRSSFLMGKSTQDPLPYLRSVVEKLNPHVSCLLLPCNTAHFWYDELQAVSEVPIFHMIQETAKRLELEKTLILSTEGTKRQGLYDVAFQKNNISFEYADNVDDVQSGINCIKQKDYQQAQHYIQGVIEHYPDHQIVFGCTEFSVVQQKTGIFSEQKYYDPMKIVVEQAIEFFLK